MPDCCSHETDAAMLRQKLKDQANVHAAEALEKDITINVMERALTLVLEEHHLNPDMIYGYIRRAELVLGVKPVMLP